MASIAPETISLYYSLSFLQLCIFIKIANHASLCVSATRVDTNQVVAQVVQAQKEVYILFIILFEVLPKGRGINNADRGISGCKYFKIYFNEFRPLR
jgi:hypothetical protein